MSHHLGMLAGELEGKPYARFWNPRVAPLGPRALATVARGPVAAPLLAPIGEAARLGDRDEPAFADGWGLAEDGSLHVAATIALPDVAPEMIGWWFGWHGDEPQRYKLWHPRAHVHASWDAPLEAGRYVGRTSFVEEYLGSELQRVRIRFVPPEELGLAAREDAIAVAARISLNAVVDAGWLVHHVRPAAGGSEMRSRFWLGGPYGAVHAGLFDRAASRAARSLVRPKLTQGHALYVHCVEEMTHLASFLPALFAVSQ